MKQADPALRLRASRPQYLRGGNRLRRGLVMSSAILVQCFAKPDTLNDLCNSLIQCEGAQEFHLVFWSDALGAGAQAERHSARNRQVELAIATFTRDHAHCFASVAFHRNEVNQGTCATCRIALDATFIEHDYVIFTEDDTIFARDALWWFAALAKEDLLTRPEILALAGESIFFDSRARALPPGHAVKAKAAAIARNLAAEYLPLNFVPSTCFATTREKWRSFGALRGQPQGDEDVCKLCKDEGLFAVFPIVARVKDVGMLHADGYSVGILGKDHVPEIKNTYLMSDDLPPSTQKIGPFTGNVGRLFEESVQMHTFDLPAPAIRAGAVPWKLWCFSLRNYGDALTPYILGLHNVPFELVTRFEEANLLGIGSNLDRLRRDNSPIVVWSAGFMYPKDRPVSYGPDVRFLAVRGRNTAALVDHIRPSDPVLGDGGILIGDLFNFSNVVKRYELGILPHMSDVRASASLGLSSWTDARMIDVLAPIEEVIREIASCRRILSSSLHGIVTADAFGVPSAYAIFEGGRNVEGDGFKYADYSSAVGYEITSVYVGAGTSCPAVMSAIDALAVRNLPDSMLRKDLEMTLHVLRAGALGLCSI